MSIILHVIFAVISLAATAVTAFAPSPKRLVVTYVSIVLTIGSGVALALVDHTVIARVCMSGLAYLSLEAAGVLYSITKIRRTA